MNKEEIEKHRDETVKAMNLIKDCLRLNGVCDSIAVGAMSSLIANILIQNDVPPGRVDEIFHSLSKAVASVGSGISRFS